MLTTVALGLVLGIDPYAARAEVAGGVVAELRGGVAPVVPTGPSEPSVLFVVTPNVDLRVGHRRGGEFVLGYAPRILLRVPNQLDQKRPLFLHQIQSTYGIAMSRTWDFGAQALVSVGELDYTAFATTLNQMQGAVPDANVIQYAIGDFSTSFTGRLRPRHTLSIAPSAGFRRPIGDDRPGAGADGGGALALNLPDQVSGTLGLGYGWQATARDELEVWTYQGVVDFDPGALFLNVDARVGWNRALRPRLSSYLNAGIFVAHVLKQPEPLRDEAGQLLPGPDIGGRVLPVAQGGLLGRLYGRARFRLDGGLGVGYTGFFDPILGRVQPRAGGSVQLQATFVPRWSVGLTSSVFTAATQDPLPPIQVMGEDDVAQSETVFLNQLPVTYRLDDHMTFEFGALVNVRTPHFRADAFRSGTQLEAWGYVAFRVAGGTGRGRREVRRGGGSIGAGSGANVGAAGTGLR